MTGKKLLVMTLVLILAFLLVPNVSAQSTSDINFSDIIKALGPRTGINPNTGVQYPGEYIIWDILLYLIFFISLVSMLLIPDKQLTVTLLNFVVILAALVSKVIVAPGAFIDPCDLPVLAINAGMFVIPLICAGMVRGVNKYSGTSKALYTCGITGFLGGAYFFLTIALEIRHCEATSEMLSTGKMVASILLNI